MHARILILIATVGLAACMTTDPAATRGKSLPQDTAERRAQLQLRVSEFLTEIAALEPATLAPRLEFPTVGLLPGWRDAICPQVTGLPAQQSEFLLARVADIARTAGARVGGEGCTPNLLIVLTPRPAQLLKVMEKDNVIGAYGPRGRPYLVDEFIASARPVRVWYDIYAGSPVSFTYAISGVFVIIDQARLQGVSLGQLADYTAMVGLAEIKPGARLGDAPSILKLFAGAPGAAPAGLSAWDQAFLKSLYSSATWPHPWQRERCESAGQCEVDQLVLRMVSNIVP